MCDLYRQEEGGAPRTGITEFVDELVVATTNSRIYWKDHPRVRGSIQSLRRCLEAETSGGVEQQIIIGAAEGFLFHQRRPLLGASLSAAKVIQSLTGVGAGGFSVDRKADDQDFMALIEVLSEKHGFESFDEANKALAGLGCKSIRFLPEYRGGDHASSAKDVELIAALGGQAQDHEDFEIPVVLYQQTVALLQDAMVRACHGEDLKISEAKGFVEAILGKLTAEASTMMGIARYERYDAYTFGHSIRVCFLALYFAASLFDDEELLLRVGMAALLHDIGKAWVPFEILHSTAPLTKEERLEMNKHTTFGGEILLELDEVDPLSITTAVSHHQRLDGGGYPITLHHARQSICTRIIKICDVYEALTAARPYKPRMSPVRAYRIMMSMKSHFDSGLLRRFIAVNGVYPVGGQVKLSTGELALVVKQSQELTRPVVRLELDDLGGDLSTDDRATLDLSLLRDDGSPEVEELIEGSI